MGLAILCGLSGGAAAIFLALWRDAVRELQRARRDAAQNEKDSQALDSIFLTLARGNDFVLTVNGVVHHFDNKARGIFRLERTVSEEKMGENKCM